MGGTSEVGVWKGAECEGRGFGERVYKVGRQGVGRSSWKEDMRLYILRRNWVSGIVRLFDTYRCFRCPTEAQQSSGFLTY